MTPELIAHYACKVGEVPVWHPEEKRLYWADIATGRMFRYDPADGSHEQVYEGDNIVAMTLQADGSLLLVMGDTSLRTWRNGVLTTIREKVAVEPGARFNDAIADPMGRVFSGTVENGTSGKLYRIDADGCAYAVAEGIGWSNGLGFNLSRDQLYFADSTGHVIHQFDYEAQSGAISNRRIFATIPEGLPDGLTVDAEGCVWLAVWDGGCLIRFSPDGAELERIAFPTPKVSSATFGGDDYGDLYVTTAGGDDPAKNGESAGALFRLRPGVHGLPEFRSRIGV